MIKTESVENVARAFQTLLGLKDLKLAAATESEKEFSLRQNIGVKGMPGILNALVPHSDTLNVQLEYTIQSGKGHSQLGATGLQPRTWKVDESLSPPILTEKGDSLFEKLLTSVEPKTKRIDVSSFAQLLVELEQEKALIKPELYISFKKEEWIAQLALPQNVMCRLYILESKLIEKFDNTNLPELCNFLIPQSQDRLILLLGDVLGSAKGPSINILGCDSWGDLGAKNIIPDERVNQAVTFRQQECSWEIPIRGITPYHTHIEASTLQDSRCRDYFRQLCDLLSILYLGNRSKLPGLQEGQVNSEFRGVKPIQISLPPLTGKQAKNSLYELFVWAYAEELSDKLAIVRHIISIVLPSNEESIFKSLMDKSPEILGAARSNYQLALLKRVESYFEKRLKVSEFLQKYNKDVGDSVSSLGNELVANLYKTAGVIVGAVIAAAALKSQILFIIFLTSQLYFLYLVFILLYLMPSEYWRFHNRDREYRHNLDKQKDILSPVEVANLEGDLYKRARSTYLIYFGATNIAYAALATVAFLWMMFARQ